MAKKSAEFNPSRKNIFDESHLRVGFSWGGLFNQAIPEDLQKKFFVPQPLPPPLYSDEYWMLEAIKESSRGIGITNPNPSVGCVIVASDGRTELARGCTQSYGGLHGEAVALSQVNSTRRTKELKNATLYVTLEPCSHTGRQPPCVDQILKSPIRKVVIANRDPHPLVNGKGISKLLRAKKEVQVGTLGPEALACNFPFFLKAFHQNHQTHLERPVIGLKWAQTLDGQLADDNNLSRWITGPVARSYTHWIRQKYDGIAIGANTLIRDLPSLDARDCNLPHQHDPVPIILDPKGRVFDLSVDQVQKLRKTLFRPGRKVVLVTSRKQNFKRYPEWIKKLDSLVVFSSESSPKDFFPHDLASTLKHPDFLSLASPSDQPLQSILLEGGAKTLAGFLNAKLVDILHVFIAPLHTGGTNNRITTLHPLRLAQRFHTFNQARLGDDLLLEMIPRESSH